jgi:uncharacterized protein YdiU (UPF0061 family)
MAENEEEKIDETKPKESEPETDSNQESEKSDAKNPEPQKGDEASGTDGKETEKEKAWKTEQNARFAELRRKNEELERQLNVFRSEKRENVTEDALKKLGLTRDDLEDDDNMVLATEYTKALARGDEDPIASAYKSLWKSSKEAKRKAKEEADSKAKADAETKAKVNEDVAEFRKKYPDVNINDLVKEDSEFNQMFGDVPDVIGNITKYYGRYLKLKGNDAKKVTEADKAKSNPYVKGSGSSVGGEKLTKAQAMALPPKEFEAYIAKLKANKH